MVTVPPEIFRTHDGRLRRSFGYVLAVLVAVAAACVWVLILRA